MQGHVADLVEEDRPSVGYFEEAFFCARGAGKGAFFITEELGLDQVLRQGRAVDADDRRPRKRAFVVDRLGDEVLSRSRFAGDQHRTVHGGRHVHEPDDLGKRAAVAHNIGERALLVARIHLNLLDPLQIQRPDGVLDGVPQFLDVEGFREVVVGAETHRGNGVLEAGKSGNEDDLGLVVLFEDGRGQGVSLPVGKLLVQQHDIDPSRRTDLKAFRAGVRRKDLQPVALKIVLHAPAQDLFVIDDEQRLFTAVRHTVPPADKCPRSFPGP